jgi:hypothetical protein
LRLFQRVLTLEVARAALAGWVSHQSAQDTADEPDTQ